MSLGLKGNSQGTTCIVVFAIFQFLAVVAYALRIWSRRINRIGLALNDYLITTALIVASGLGSCMVATVLNGGVGRHIVTVPPENILTLLKIYIAGAYLWAVANTFVKLSMLHLYVNLFPSRHLQLWARITAVLVMCYCLTTILESTLLCRPFEFNWDKTIEGGYCANERIAWLTAGILNLLLDVVIVVLPLPLLWKLHLPLLKKLGVIFMLSVGIFICIITILRIESIYTLDFTDFTYNAATVEIWSILEPYLGLINACIPVMQPAMRKIFRSPQKDGKGLPLSARSGTNTIGGSGGSSAKAKRNFQRLDDYSYALASIDGAPEQDRERLAA